MRWSLLCFMRRNRGGNKLCNMRFNHELQVVRDWVDISMRQPHEPMRIGFTWTSEGMKRSIIGRPTVTSTSVANQKLTLEVCM